MTTFVIMVYTMCSRFIACYQEFLFQSPRSKQSVSTTFVSVTSFQSFSLFISVFCIFCTVEPLDPETLDPLEFFTFLRCLFVDCGSLNEFKISVEVIYSLQLPYCLNLLSSVWYLTRLFSLLALSQQLLTLFSFLTEITSSSLK